MKNFDLCPHTMSSVPGSFELWEIVCSSGSVLHALQFYPPEAKDNVKKELCALEKRELGHLYSAIKNQYSYKRFLMQVRDIFRA